MSDAAETHAVPVPRRRRWLVYALSGGLIVGHAYDVATKGEHWPISSYPMYADLNPSTFKLVRLWGQTNEVPPREIPIDPAWMRGSIMRIMRRPDALSRLRQAITQFAHSYGWNAWAPAGTEFVVFRVYEQEWTLRADADPDRPADRTRLLLEVKRGGPVAAAAAAATTAATSTSPLSPSTTAAGEASRDAAR